MDGLHVSVLDRQALHELTAKDERASNESKTRNNFPTPMSKPIKVIASALILFLLAFLFLVETIPPRGLTATRLTVTKRRILQYGHLHNKLPLTLAELPARPGYDNETTDAWQRPLDYRSDESGAVTLRSLGADKLPGGEGDNRDMTGVFMSRDAQNRWQEELAEWKRDPVRP